LKIVTVRGQWISAVIVTMAVPVTTFLVVSTGGLSSGETTTSGAAAGSLAGLLAFGTWSATIAAGEYAQGTMVMSLSTVPRRPVLYAAKLTAIATAAGAGALLSAIFALLVVLGVRAPGTYGLGDPATLVSVVIAVITVAVIGVSVGVITRSPTASIAIVAVVLLLPKAASGLLGGLQPWIVGASPSTVVTEIVGGGQLPASQTYPAGTWAATLTMLLVAAVVAGGGAFALLRRDG
jgi:ABC-type transport system involved in multi-copper enzyme maturation permease subunit